MSNINKPLPFYIKYSLMGKLLDNSTILWLNLDSYASTELISKIKKTDLFVGKNNIVFLAATNFHFSDYLIPDDKNHAEIHVCNHDNKPAGIFVFDKFHDCEFKKFKCTLYEFFLFDIIENVDDINMSELYFKIHQNPNCYFEEAKKRKLCYH